jgi:hypothetical protein
VFLMKVASLLFRFRASSFHFVFVFFLESCVCVCENDGGVSFLVPVFFFSNLQRPISHKQDSLCTKHFLVQFLLFIHMFHFVCFSCTDSAPAMRK